VLGDPAELLKVEPRSLRTTNYRPSSTAIPPYTELPKPISSAAVMPNPPLKRLKRDEYRAAKAKDKEEGLAADLPRKKYYRQRAHANPFSDHQLE
jgi:hypothetical protein